VKITPDQCRAALQSPRVRAFLRVIREGETSQGELAYRTIVGGGQFDSFADHPRQLIDLPSLGVKSTAAGAYQFLSRTWDGCRAALDLPDFSPASQDLAAVYLIHGRGALDDVLAGDIALAISKCGKEWASLPGSPYGQPTMTMSRALAAYQRWLAVDEASAPAQNDAGAAIDLAPIPTQPPRPQAAPWPFPRGGEVDPAESTHTSAGEAESPERNMVAPLVGLAASFFTRALVDKAVETIPKLARTYGSGSKVAERNIGAVELIADVVKTAVGAKNEQEAVEKLTTDPAARMAAEKAVEQRWADIGPIEGGGGGTAGARAAITGADADSPIWRIVAVVTYAALFFLLLANIMSGAAWVVAVVRDVGVESATQFVSQVLQADIGAAMVAFGFWLGSSWGSKQKTGSAP
jgi:muramidase (phage lysozyme)